MGRSHLSRSILFLFVWATCVAPYAQATPSKNVREEYILRLKALKNHHNPALSKKADQILDLIQNRLTFSKPFEKSGERYVICSYDNHKILLKYQRDMLRVDPFITSEGQALAAATLLSAEADDLFNLSFSAPVAGDPKFREKMDELRQAHLLTLDWQTPSGKLQSALQKLRAAASTHPNSIIRDQARSWIRIRIQTFLQTAQNHDGFFRHWLVQQLTRELLDARNDPNQYELSAFFGTSKFSSSLAPEVLLHPGIIANFSHFTLTGAFFLQTPHSLVNEITEFFDLSLQALPQGSLSRYLKQMKRAAYFSAIQTMTISDQENKGGTRATLRGLTLNYHYPNPEKNESPTFEPLLPEPESYSRIAQIDLDVLSIAESRRLLEIASREKLRVVAFNPKLLRVDEIKKLVLKSDAEIVAQAGISTLLRFRNSKPMQALIAKALAELAMAGKLNHFNYYLDGKYISMEEILNDAFYLLMAEKSLPSNFENWLKKWKQERFDQEYSLRVKWGTSKLETQSIQDVFAKTKEKKKVEAELARRVQNGYVLPSEVGFIEIKLQKPKRSAIFKRWMELKKQLPFALCFVQTGKDEQFLLPEKFYAFPEETKQPEVRPARVLARPQIAVPVDPFNPDFWMENQGDLQLRVDLVDAHPPVYPIRLFDLSGALQPILDSLAQQQQGWFSIDGHQ